MKDVGKDEFNFCLRKITKIKDKYDASILQKQERKMRLVADNRIKMSDYSERDVQRFNTAEFLYELKEIHDTIAKMKEEERRIKEEAAKQENDKKKSDSDSKDGSWATDNE